MPDHTRGIVQKVLQEHNGESKDEDFTSRPRFRFCCLYTIVSAIVFVSGLLAVFKVLQYTIPYYQKSVSDRSFPCCQ